jgi:dTDP-4-amino-4,6-dideoxygalactose transaminase
MTFAASAEIAYYFGARPILTDVDRETHCVRVEDLVRARTPKTRAVVVVHFGGAACDMEAISDWCRAEGLLLIEDCAHATETRLGERHVGTFGDVGCYSFYSNKNLSAGEGGMLVCRDPKVMEHARLLHLHGMSKDAWKRFETGGHWRYDIVEAGFKYNLTDIASAIGLVQLSRLEEMAARRRRIVHNYHSELSQIPGLTFQTVNRHGTPAHHLFVVRVDEAVAARDELVSRLGAQGIGVSVHYIPLHRMSFYASQNYRPEDYPNADWIGRTTLSLPLYPDLSEQDQERIIETLKAELRGTDAPLA